MKYCPDYCRFIFSQWLHIMQVLGLSTWNTAQIIAGSSSHNDYTSCRCGPVYMKYCPDYCRFIFSQWLHIMQVWGQSTWNIAQIIADSSSHRDYTSCRCVACLHEILPRLLQVHLLTVITHHAGVGPVYMKYCPDYCRFIFSQWLHIMQVWGLSTWNTAQIIAGSSSHSDYTSCRCGACLHEILPRFLQIHLLTVPRLLHITGITHHAGGPVYMKYCPDYCRFIFSQGLHIMQVWGLSTWNTAQIIAGSSSHSDYTSCRCGACLHEILPRLLQVHLLTGITHHAGVGPVYMKYCPDYCRFIFSQWLHIMQVWGLSTWNTAQIIAGSSSHSDYTSCRCGACLHEILPRLLQVHLLTVITHHAGVGPVYLNTAQIIAGSSSHRDYTSCRCGACLHEILPRLLQVHLLTVIAHHAGVGPVYMKYCPDYCRFIFSQWLHIMQVWGLSTWNTAQIIAGSSSHSDYTSCRCGACLHEILPRLLQVHLLTVITHHAGVGPVYMKYCPDYCRFIFSQGLHIMQVWGLSTWNTAQIIAGSSSHSDYTSCRCGACLHEILPRLLQVHLLRITHHAGVGLVYMKYCPDYCRFIFSQWLHIMQVWGLSTWNTAQIIAGSSSHSDYTSCRCGACLHEILPRLLQVHLLTVITHHAGVGLVYMKYCPDYCRFIFSQWLHIMQVWGLSTWNNCPDYCRFIFSQWLHIMQVWDQSTWNTAQIIAGSSSHSDEILPRLLQVHLLTVITHHAGVGPVYMKYCPDYCRFIFSQWLHIMQVWGLSTWNTAQIIAGSSSHSDYTSCRCGACLHEILPRLLQVHLLTVITHHAGVGPVYMKYCPDYCRFIFSQWLHIMQVWGLSTWNTAQIIAGSSSHSDYTSCRCGACLHEILPRLLQVHLLTVITHHAGVGPVYMKYCPDYCRFIFSQWLHIMQVWGLSTWNTAQIISAFIILLVGFPSRWWWCCRQEPFNPLAPGSDFKIIFKLITQKSSLITCCEFALR